MCPNKSLLLSEVMSLTSLPENDLSLIVDASFSRLLKEIGSGGPPGWDLKKTSAGTLQRKTGRATAEQPDAM